MSRCPCAMNILGASPVPRAVTHRTSRARARARRSPTPAQAASRTSGLVRQTAMSSLLLEYLDQVYRAAMRRDQARMRELLEHGLAMQLPGEVRAEALAIVNAPRASLRAPIRMLQHRQRIVQLEMDLPDEDDTQLELDLRGQRQARAALGADD